MTGRPIGMKRILALPVAMLAVTMAGCGDEDSSEAIGDEPAGLSLADLDGRAFASVGIDGRQLVEGTQVRLDFVDGQVRAHAGCNHLSGPVSVDGTALVAAGLAGTEIGCPARLQDQDTWLADFLTAGPEASLDGDRLTLGNDGVVLELTEQAQPDQPDRPDGDPDEPTSDDGGVVSSG